MKFVEYGKRGIGSSSIEGREAVHQMFRRMEIETLAREHVPPLVIVYEPRRPLPEITKIGLPDPPHIKDRMTKRQRRAMMRGKRHTTGSGKE